MMGNIEQEAEEIRRAEGKIHLAKDRLLGRYRFHAALLDRMRVTADPTIGTMAVTVKGEDLVLLHSPPFVLEISIDELGGVLLHELNHVLFGHLTMDKNDYPDAHALTIAQEVTVNEWIQEPLPLCPVTLKSFPGLPPRESTSERYRRLEDKTKKSNQPLTLDNHEAWAKIKDKSQAEAIVKEVIEDTVATVPAEQIPGELRALLKIGNRGGNETKIVGRREGAKVDWRQLLHRFVGRVLEVRPNYCRPPRRFPMLVGVLPGWARQAVKAKIMAVIDTSASISEQNLSQIHAEIRRLAKRHSVLIVECDAAVQRTYEYRQTLKVVSGRGGTDLRPPLARKFLRRHRPDLILYFTDGLGPAPERPPPVAVIWCLLGGELETRTPASWGRVVRVH
jgi:predicted metal-dependent peptidase